MSKKPSDIKSDSDPKIEISHAPTSVVSQHEDLTIEIIIKILRLTPDIVYVTDYTPMDILATTKNIIARTKKHYGIVLTEDYFKGNLLKDYVLMIVESQKSNK
jgi:hypothetical protein